MSNLVASYSSADFLALFDRLFPESYLEPLKSPGPGYELYQAAAQVGARVSLAADRVDQCAYIFTAPTGSFATVNVLFSRQVNTAGDVTVKAGTVVVTSKGDRRFATTADAVFSGGALGPISAPARAVAMGYEYNVRGQRTAADGEILPGEIDTVLELFEDPVFGDPTIVVSQVDDATGGAPAALGQHGFDRGLPQRPGEDPEAYRARIRRLPDVVTPAAIRRAIDAVFLRYGVVPTLIETWEPTYQTCWDAPTQPVGELDPDLFVYDDPRPNPPFRNRWLDEVDFRAAFIVVVPALLPLQDYGFCYDDPGTQPGDFNQDVGSVHGMRAASAYDVADTFTIELQPCYDGPDLQLQAVYLGLFELLQEIKAAGVSAVVELEGQ